MSLVVASKMIWVNSEWVILHGVIPETTNETSLRCAVSIRLKDGLQSPAGGRFSTSGSGSRIAPDDSQREAWQVKEMAVTCKSDRDLYLRFVGH
jgi:hypothetical protein